MQNIFKRHNIYSVKDILYSEKHHPEKTFMFNKFFKNKSLKAFYFNITSKYIYNIIKIKINISTKIIQLCVFRFYQYVEQF